MNEIYCILEENDVFQFSLKELTKNLAFVPDTKTIKRKLIEKYGDGILVTSQKNSETIIRFHRTMEKILSYMVHRKRR